MSCFSRPLALFLITAALTGCGTQPASLVSQPLQPGPQEPVAYVVGSIGPQSLSASPAPNQRLLFRKRGSEFGAAAIWGGAGRQTPQDVKDAAGAASIFVLALKPGDYEFYDFQFFSSSYSPTLGTTYTSVQAREKFNLPLRLKAGNTYYLGEFRSLCLGASLCAFRWRDQQARDELLARHYVPGLPTLELLPLDYRSAAPYIIAPLPAGAGQNTLHETRP
ncbi:MULTISPECIES: hypothetical protein [Pseudomonas fluorescens group]|uniref:Lipoprotein n=1 Tax=Pseudomonas fluorescens TaxID=294 RepID=A0A0D0TL77_PSEFL|nr:MULTISPECIES: hypothetical protein [Pseudomonas fluorescens group]AZE62062.1 hypothetical protein C4K02_3707 [Pseudomonas synxantha]KIR21605.1 hypothetical protein PFLU3_29550 [Pseudomonas fluorescens]